MEKVKFKSSNNITIRGILDKVNDSKKIVVVGHGFRSNKEGRTSSTIGPALNKANINTLRIDFFGHGESDGPFSKITVTQGIDDVKAAIQFVKGLGYTDIGYSGNSLGGILGTGSAINNKDLKLLCLICPVSDFPQHYEFKFPKDFVDEWRNKDSMSQKNKEGKEFRLNYSFYLDSKKWIMYDKAKDISAKVLIIHGNKDESVPLEQSQKLLPNLKNASLEIVDGCDHNFTKEEHMQILVNKVTDFFKHNL